MTPTKKQLARWADLKSRKDRDETGFFLAEGRKLVAEVRAAGWHIEALVLDDLQDPGNVGTFLDGESVFGASLTGSGLLVMGNEGRGIGATLESKKHRRLTIPRFGSDTESRNVAVAAIVMARFRRGAPRAD